MGACLQLEFHSHHTCTRVGSHAHRRVHAVRRQKGCSVQFVEQSSELTSSSTVVLSGCPALIAEQGRSGLHPVQSVVCNSACAGYSSLTNLSAEANSVINTSRNRLLAPFLLSSESSREKRRETGRERGRRQNEKGGERERTRTRQMGAYINVRVHGSRTAEGDRG